MQVSLAGDSLKGIKAKGGGQLSDGVCRWCGCKAGAVQPEAGAAVLVEVVLIAHCWAKQLLDLQGHAIVSLRQKDAFVKSSELLFVVTIVGR